MKTNWPIKKLGEVSTVLSGGTPKTGMPSFWNGDILWLTPKELSNCRDIYIDDTDRKITSEGLKNSSAKLLPKGTVLLTTRAPIGYVAIAGKELTTNQGFKNFVCDSKQLDNQYLYYWLNSNTKYLQSLGQGATFGEINKTNVERIEIPIPPLPIQQKIVERLDAIRKAQELNDLQISKTQELFESLMQKEVFDSKLKEISLDEVVLKQEFMDPKKLPEKEFNYVDISSIDRYSRQILFFKRIVGKNAPSRARKKIRDGDTVWSTVRPYLKNIAHVISLPELKVASTGFCILSSQKEVLDHNWLYYNVSSDWFIQKILPYQKGASYPAVSDQDILSQTIKLPPFEEQQKIVAKLSAIQDYKKSLLKQKALLKELFDSVLHESMAGKLD